MNRKQLILLGKLVVSVGIVAAIYVKIAHREGSAELFGHLGRLSWGWIVAAAGMQLCAIAVSVTRWERLLVGQGIHAPRRHLLGSFMIGRFFGAFTPGGWTGLNAYRLYDIAVQTGKTARSAAAIGTEMVLGQLAFGAVLVAGSIFGLQVIGWSGVLLVDGFFVVLIAVGIGLLARPTLFRKLGALLPGPVRGRLQTAIDASCAYQGKGGLVTQAALLGMATHAFNNLIYVCTARALGVQLGIGQVFFVSAMQIFATLLPASINGIGVREATAVALYGTVGVPTSVAFLIPAIGFAVEMFISAFGGLVFLSRRVGYTVAIVVDHPEREELASAAIESVPQELQPKLGRGAVLGLSGGLFGGVLLGVGEAVVVLGSGAGHKDYSVLLYAATVYGLACAVGGLCAGLGLALSGRLMARAAVDEPLAYARMTALVASGGALFIGAFRVRRDVYAEMLNWKSAQGLFVLVGCLLASAVLYLVLSTLVRTLASRSPLRLLLRAWSAPLVLCVLLGTNFVFARKNAVAAPLPTKLSARPPAPAEAGNVLFIVVDTLRADHLPSYGYAAGMTPSLDAFARDAVRYDHAFSNASWTRPSFASIMTGRYPSSHQTTHKTDSLPDGIVTLAEAMQQGGYATYGVVTNFNIAPFFHFDQGFDAYHYLEPNFVLGAGDTEAKLLFVQLLRQKIEGYRAARGQVQPGSAYQDASKVNAEVLRMLDQRQGSPFYMFVGYMDPHDPYYPHPYNGTGYARAAHQEPKPEEAPALIGLYDGEIRFWDENFGALIAALKARGLYDDLTIVVTADHGEEFLEHGGFWHGTTLYDEQVRVPLFLKLPHAERGGSVVSHWVQSIDLMPSLLRANGLPVPQGVQGKDAAIDSESAYAEEDHEGNLLRALRIKRGESTLKLIEANPNNPRGLQPYELYRMDQDPAEKVNLAHDDAEVLSLAVKRLADQGKAAKLGQAARQHLNLEADANAVQRLRALGYAGGEDKNKKKP